MRVTRAVGSCLDIRNLLRLLIFWGFQDFTTAREKVLYGKDENTVSLSAFNTADAVACWPVSLNVRGLEILIHVVDYMHLNQAVYR